MSEISVINNNAAEPVAKKGIFARAIASVNNKTAKTLFKYVAMPLAGRPWYRQCGGSDLRWQRGCLRYFR